MSYISDIKEYISDMDDSERQSFFENEAKIIDRNADADKDEWNYDRNAHHQHSVIYDICGGDNESAVKACLYFCEYLSYWISECLESARIFYEECRTILNKNYDFLD